MEQNKLEKIMPNLFQEELIKEDFSNRKPHKSFPFYIISKKTFLFKASINLDYENRQILLITEKDNISININFNDLIGFVPLDKEKMTNITNKEVENDLKDKFCFNLNFFPKFVIKKCSLCGWICCKCKETIIERKLKNIELAIDQNEVEQITDEFNKILSMESVMLIKELKYNKKRKLLLFINPIGGKGSALQKWNGVKHIFDMSNIEVEVFRTQHYHHAYEHTKVLDYKVYDGIICCSGDGIVHEVVNAIFHREDSEEFLHSVPIGVLPGGTSNGYAKCISEASKEECNLENCAYIISKGEVKEVDVLEIESMSKEKKIYAFLSLSWGIIADCDLETENYRWCGTIRFDIYGFFRWLCLRNIYASFYYLPQDSLLSLDDVPSLNHPLPQNFIRENDQFIYFWAMNTPWSGESIHCAPKSEMDDGFCDILKMKKSAGKINLVKQLFNHNSGDYDLINSGLEYIKTKCWRLIPKANLSDNDELNENKILPRSFSIDGERYPIEPIQVKTLRKAIKVFCFK